MKQKKNLKTVLIVLLVLILWSGATIAVCYIIDHRPKKDGPEVTVEAFIAELNRDNINGMLEYVEPSEAELIKAGMEKLDALTDSNVMKLLTKWLPFLSYVTQTDILPELHPDIVSVEVDENIAVVTISLVQDEITQYYDIHMIQIEGKWYIQYAWKSSFPNDGQDM